MSIISEKGRVTGMFSLRNGKLYWEESMSCEWTSLQEKLGQMNEERREWAFISTQRVPQIF